MAEDRADEFEIRNVEQSDFGVAEKPTTRGDAPAVRTDVKNLGADGGRGFGHNLARRWIPDGQPLDFGAGFVTGHDNAVLARKSRPERFWDRERAERFPGGCFEDFDDGFGLRIADRNDLISAGVCDNSLKYFEGPEKAPGLIL